MASSAKPNFRVLGWNVENYGMSKDKKCGDALIDFIAEVIRKKDVKVAAFSEIRSDRAEKIGERLKAKLDKLGGTWAFHPSQAWGVKRWEQYLFVWDTSVVTANTPADFQDEITDDKGSQIGFWRLTKDRPPFIAKFTTVNLNIPMSIAIMHSPAPQPWTYPRDAAKALALVPGLQDPARTTVLLGDFNVAFDAQQSTVGQYGEAAFTELVKIGLEQILPDMMDSSLIGRGWIPADLDSCRSSPYDQIFARAGAPAPTFVDPAVENLIEDVCAPAQDVDIEQALIKLHNQGFGSSQVSPMDLETAFKAYRELVSDHLPISVGIKF